VGIASRHHPDNGRRQRRASGGEQALAEQHYTSATPIVLRSSLAVVATEPSFCDQPEKITKANASRGYREREQAPHRTEMATGSRAVPPRCGRARRTQIRKGATRAGASDRGRGTRQTKPAAGVTRSRPTMRSARQGCSPILRRLTPNDQQMPAIRRQPRTVFETRGFLVGDGRGVRKKLKIGEVE